MEHGLAADEFATMACGGRASSGQWVAWQAVGCDVGHQVGTGQPVCERVGQVEQVGSGAMGGRGSGQVGLGWQ
jgi:hypothetical protein